MDGIGFLYIQSITGHGQVLYLNHASCLMQADRKILVPRVILRSAASSPIVEVIRATLAFLASFHFRTCYPARRASSRDWRRVPIYHRVSVRQ
jgi:hypothetical protein